MWLFLSAITIATAQAAAETPLAMTTRQMYMPSTGRQEWLANNTAVSWLPSETAIVIVDM